MQEAAAGCKCTMCCKVLRKYNRMVCFVDPHSSRENLLNVHGSSIIIDRAARHAAAPVAVRQQTDKLCSSNSQEQMLVNPVNDHSRTTTLKVFPFLQPSVLCPQEPDFAVIARQQVFKEGGSFCKAHIVPFPLDPSRDVEVSSDSCTRSSTSGRQLTIFYKGQVKVYNNVLSAMAQHIVLFGAGGDHPSVHERPYTTQANGPSACSRTVQDNLEDISIARLSDKEAEPVVPQSLLQARKASLACFLERRKARLMTTFPYNRLGTNH
ncbi:hypothetical protein L7F22_010839 [Adiantum nelumboides]|nr:hypothetical protein [Adiantum nelumboides]